MMMRRAGVAGVLRGWDIGEKSGLDSEGSHQHVERLIGVGGSGFGKGIDIGGVRILVEEEQRAVTQHGHGGDGVGIAATSFVLSQAGILAPMIADFDAAPVSTNTFEPLLRTHRLGGEGTEVVARKPVCCIFERR